MAIFYVNSSQGNDSASGSELAPWKSLSKALEKANTGDVIQLAPGTYSTGTGEVFPLIIPPGVTVQGNESSQGINTFIQGSGKIISPTAAGQNVTILMQKNSFLKGVKVTNSDIRGTGVWIESTSATVTNCTFTQCKREGIFATGSAIPKIVDNVFVDNSAAGVIMAGNASGEIKRNLFKNTGYGISLQAKSAPVITENKIQQNRSGIVLSGEARPILRKNEIEGNTQDGLAMISQSLPDLGSTQDPGGNIFRNNGQFDLQNATEFKIASVGNQLNPLQIKGLIDLVGNINPTPSPSPNPVPTPSPTPAPKPTPTPSPTPISVKFVDITNHWAKEFIERLATLGIVSGFPDQTFQPDQSLTRAQFAALLAKAFDFPGKRENALFKDIPNNFWGKQAVEKVYRSGFMSGYPDSTFRPNQNLIRVQAIVALVTGLDLKGGNPNSLGVYLDRTQIPSYATDKIAIATERKIVVNYPNREQLSPLRDITRGEVCAILYQVLVATNRTQPINSPYIV